MITKYAVEPGAPDLAGRAERKHDADDAYDRTAAGKNPKVALEEDEAQCPQGRVFADPQAASPPTGPGASMSGHCSRAGHIR